MDKFETKRFILKCVEKQHISDIFNILSNPKVIENLNMNIHNKIEDTEDLLKKYYECLDKKEMFPYEIIDKNNKDFIGVFLIKLDLYNEDSFEFTIYLDEKHWNKGVYTEVIPYMVKVAFDEINTKNFRGYVKEKNIASRKVLEKAGFSLEKKFYVDGIPDLIYSYIKVNDN